VTAAVVARALPPRARAQAPRARAPERRPPTAQPARVSSAARAARAARGGDCRGRKREPMPGGGRVRTPWMQRRSTPGGVAKHGEEALGRMRTGRARAAGRSPRRVPPAAPKSRGTPEVLAPEHVAGGRRRPESGGGRWHRRSRCPGAAELAPASSTTVALPPQSPGDHALPAVDRLAASGTDARPRLGWASLEEGW